MSWVNQDDALLVPFPGTVWKNPSGALDTHVLSSCGRVGGESALVIRQQIT